jgi:hypothetical protein
MQPRRQSLRGNSHGLASSGEKNAGIASK